MAPSAFLLAGAAASAAILAGAALPVAAVAGAVGWLARVALAVPRKPAGDRVDPFAVGEPWRRFVLDAQQARRRFDTVVKRSRGGPVRERLEAIGRRIDDGVNASWRIACQGDNLSAGLQHLRLDEVEREIHEVDSDLRHTPEGPSRESLLRTRAALMSQRDSYGRLARVARDASDRLRVLNAQLDEAVARALEISLHGDVGDLDPIGSDVDSVVSELEALRLGLEEAGGQVTSSA